MLQDNEYTLPNSVYLQQFFDMYSMNIGAEDTEEVPVKLIYTERIEQTYEYCSYRDVIMVMD